MKITRNTKLATFLMITVLMLALAACGTPSFVKPTHVTKDTAETVLYQARVMQNKGTLTAAQFDTVRKAYDALKVAQDTVIDARIAYLTESTTTKQAILNAAISGVSKNLAAFMQLATDFGIMGGDK